MPVVFHNIPPLFDRRARVLILGSFPSVRSRETAFFYGHPQNRFWPMLAEIFGSPIPETVPEKRALILSHRLALWDVVKQCDIRGSEDSALRSPELNDLSPVLAESDIKAIFLNGKKASQLLMKRPPAFAGDICPMPSTSPANASVNLRRLVECWRRMLDYLAADG